MSMLHCCFSLLFFLYLLSSFIYAKFYPFVFYYSFYVFPLPPNFYLLLLLSLFSSSSFFRSLLSVCYYNISSLHFSFLIIAHVSLIVHSLAPLFSFIFPLHQFCINDNMEFTLSQKKPWSSQQNPKFIHYYC